tara:strand:- start:8027 stop:8275 length:249 start_codon:yes stop_codon:yes gene_type:complete
MRVNEARVVIFLNSTDKRFHYASEISSKLKIDYAYLLKTLKTMKGAGWVYPIKRERKIFYSLFNGEEHIVKDAIATLSKFNT